MTDRSNQEFICKHCSLSSIIFVRFFSSLKTRFASSLFSFLIELSLFPMIKKKKKKTSPSCKEIYKSYGYFFFQFTFPLVLWYPAPHSENWIGSLFWFFFNLRNHWSMLRRLSHIYINFFSPGTLKKSPFHEM